MRNLTIAIPTYNRNELLNEALALLLPQLTDDVECLVIDNASVRPVAVSVEERFGEAAQRIRVVRNVANIGLCANVLRCLEQSEGRWVWLLGDDDRPLPDAVHKVQRAVSSQPDSIYLNFSSTLHQRDKPFDSRGFRDFVAKMDSFGNVMFISAGVFRREPLLRHAHLGYHFAYSLASHVVVLMAALGDEGECSFLSETLVEWGPNNRGDGWSSLDLVLGMPLILELPFPFEIKRQLAKKIGTKHDTPEQFYVPLRAYGSTPERRLAAGHLYRQLYARYAPFITNRKRRAVLWLLNRMLNQPSAAIARVFDAIALPFIRSRVMNFDGGQDRVLGTLGHTANWGTTDPR
jgi:glycosyltransferase involved in cell wall biosynthesis